MTPTQIELVQNSWKTVEGRSAQTAGKFLCSQLLEIVPEIKPMFCYRTKKIQPRKISLLISYIIRKLNGKEDIIHQVENLARHHIQFDVEDTQYISMGSALLEVLEMLLGDAWNKELQAAWINCYTTLAEAVMNATRVEEEAFALCG